MQTKDTEFISSKNERSMVGNPAWVLKSEVISKFSLSDTKMKILGSLNGKPYKEKGIHPLLTSHLLIASFTYPFIRLMVYSFGHLICVSLVFPIACIL